MPIGPDVIEITGLKCAVGLYLSAEAISVSETTGSWRGREWTRTKSLSKQA